MKKSLWLALIAFFFLALPVFAQSDQTQSALEEIPPAPGALAPEQGVDFYRAKVVEILSAGKKPIDGVSMDYQEVKLQILNGDEKGKTIIIDHGGPFAIEKYQKVKEGETVIIAKPTSAAKEIGFFVGAYPTTFRPIIQLLITIKTFRFSTFPIGAFIPLEERRYPLIPHASSLRGLAHSLPTFSRKDSTKIRYTYLALSFLRTGFSFYHTYLRRIEICFAKNCCVLGMNNLLARGMVRARECLLSPFITVRTDLVVILMGFCAATLLRASSTVSPEPSRIVLSSLSETLNCGGVGSSILRAADNALSMFVLSSTVTFLATLRGFFMQTSIYARGY